MAGSSLGHYLVISTFGESHGAGIGVTMDGLPPGLEISEEVVQKQLDRRRPGQSDITTPRRETDKVSILSGVFEGKTTGTPLAMLLHNMDARSSDYGGIAEKFRPGHADYTYFKRYGFRDWRGSGRASGRETAARVAAGAVARQWLDEQGVAILAFVQRAAGIRCETFDMGYIEENPMRACDRAAARKMEERIRELIEIGDSAGGVIECRIKGVPPGLGNPVFNKLEADLGGAILSIGAVRGFEIGAGFRAADMRGSEHNDQMDSKGFRSNNAGGIIGGISTGQEIVFRAAVKPASSIGFPQTTRNTDGETVDISTEGRHDPTICPRMVPVVEAMAAIVLMDQWLGYRALRGLDPPGSLGADH